MHARTRQPAPEREAPLSVGKEGGGESLLSSQHHSGESEREGEREHIIRAHTQSSLVGGWARPRRRRRPKQSRRTATADAARRRARHAPGGGARAGWGAGRRAWQRQNVRRAAGDRRCCRPYCACRCWGRAGRATAERRRTASIRGCRNRRNRRRASCGSGHGSGRHARHALPTATATATAAHHRLALLLLGLDLPQRQRGRRGRGPPPRHQ
jgi:hypothetical protein